jgi:hypothetical protein
MSKESKMSSWFKVVCRVLIYASRITPDAEAKAEEAVVMVNNEVT